MMSMMLEMMRPVDLRVVSSYLCFYLLDLVMLGHMIV